MKPLGFAPKAVNDLREIARYIARDDPDRATGFVAELERKAGLAAAHPLGFRERPDISPGLRAIGHGRYLILFRDLDEHVRIVRVVHAARDLPRLFE